MYRVVEGGTKTMSRATAPLVQQTARGKTWTGLDLNFGLLQGEWLKAVDVEESSKASIYVVTYRP